MTPAVRLPDAAADTRSPGHLRLAEAMTQQAPRSASPLPPGGLGGANPYATAGARMSRRTLSLRRSQGLQPSALHFKSCRAPGEYRGPAKVSYQEKLNGGGEVSARRFHVLVSARSLHLLAAPEITP